MSDQSLARIADRLAVSDLLTHYCHCLHSGRAELLEAEVFDAEVDVNLGWGRWATGAEASAGIRRNLEHFSGTMHALSNERIEIRGEEATSTVCVQAYHWLAAGDDGDPLRP